MLVLRAGLKSSYGSLFLIGVFMVADDDGGGARATHQTHTPVTSTNQLLFKTNQLYGYLHG